MVIWIYGFKPFNHTAILLSRNSLLTTSSILRLDT